MLCFRCQKNLEDLTPYYCCNKDKVFCSKCKGQKCETCGQIKTYMSIKEKTNQPTKCSKCKNSYPNEELFEKSMSSYWCMICLNYQFQKTKYALRKQEKGRICQYLKRFCCFCFKKISKRCIQLQDGRKIDSICYQSNQNIQQSIKTWAAKCQKCFIILGNSLQISSISPSEMESCKNICKRCQKEMGFKQNEQTLEQSKKCFECKKYFISGTLTQQNVVICDICEILKKINKKTNENKQSPSTNRRKNMFNETKYQGEEKFNQTKYERKQKCSECYKQFQTNHNQQKSQNLCNQCQVKKQLHKKHEHQRLNDSLLNERKQIQTSTKSIQCFTAKANGFDLNNKLLNSEIDPYSIAINKNPNKKNIQQGFKNKQVGITSQSNNIQNNFVKVVFTKQASKVKKCNQCQAYLSEQSIFYYSNILDYAKTTNSSITLIAIHKQKIQQSDRLKNNLKEFCLLCLIQLGKKIGSEHRRAATAQKEAKRLSPKFNSRGSKIQHLGAKQKNNIASNQQHLKKSFKIDQMSKNQVNYKLMLDSKLKKQTKLDSPYFNK